MQFIIDATPTRRPKLKIIEIMERMYALEDNLLSVFEYIRREDSEKMMKEYFGDTPIRNLPMYVDRITYFAKEGDYLIEFVDDKFRDFTLNIMSEDEATAHDVTWKIETKEENEECHIDYDFAEDLGDYVVGGLKSFFRQLGDSEYYFRVL